MKIIRNLEDLKGIYPYRDKSKVTINDFIAGVKAKIEEHGLF